MDDLENELGLPREPENDTFSVDSSTSSKKAKPPIPITPMLTKSKLESGFHESSRLCLEGVRTAMLQHRWEEAAEDMVHLLQILEDTTKGQEVQQKELLWRMAVEILHHLPNSKLEDYNNVYERMKQSGFKNHLQICLEHSFHLLLMDHIHEAKNTLSVGESWRYGKETLIQSKMIQLLKAYRGLLDYTIWSEKKQGDSSTDIDNSDEHQAVHNYFRQASANLKETFKNPGVWDPFIISYVEMLEFYEDFEEAKRVLSDYAYDESFPPNPNAHVYLYHLLQRHNTPARKLIKVLAILHSLVPSHVLMSEYCSLLLESGKTAEALEVTMDMLDYACWRNNLDIWKRLETIIQTLQTTGGCEEAVSEVMSGRTDWWPALHFTTHHAALDRRENPELRAVKAPLARILCPGLTLRYCDVDTNS